MTIARCVSPMASCRIASALLGQSKTSTVAENWGTSVSEPSTSPARYSRETTSLSKGNTARWEMQVLKHASDHGFQASNAKWLRQIDRRPPIIHELKHRGP